MEERDSRTAPSPNHHAQERTSDRGRPDHDGPEDLVLMDILRMFIRRPRVFIGPIMAMAILAVLWVWSSPILYTAVIRVAPPIDESEFTGLNRSRSLGGGFSGVAAFLPGLDGAPDPAFQRYTDMLVSVRLARVLMNDPVIPSRIFASEWRDGRWQEPASLMYRLKRLPKDLFGVGGWVPPDAQRLSAYLGTALDLNASKSGVTTISYSHTDREFALNLLLKVHAHAEKLMREDGIEQGQVKRAFIARRLQDTSISDLRNVLINLMAEVEQQDMLLTDNLPYAAELIDLPVVSSLPTSPKPVLQIVLLAFAGVLIGMTAVIMTEMLIGSAPLGVGQRRPVRRAKSRPDKPSSSGAHQTHPPPARPAGRTTAPTHVLAAE